MNPANYRKELTAKIIKMLEEGTAPWVKPWDPSLAPPMSPINGITGRPYHGGNALWLGCQDYADPRWATYKAISEAGGQVLKGEKSTSVEYWQWTEKKRNEQGEMIEVKLETPRVFYANVFNFQQAENLPEFKIEPPSWDPCQEAERILTNSGADIRYDKTDTAYYTSKHDQIHMPPKVMFPDAAGFYSVALHELGHWTGHESRLGRQLGNGFGTADYAKEELRAELSSFFLASRLGIPHDPGQHASYIKSWIQVLEQDHNEIFRAAKDAEKISEFVLQFQQEKTLTNEVEVVKESTSEPTRKRSREVELEC